MLTGNIRMLAALAIALSVVTLSQQLPEIGKCPDNDGDIPTYYPDPTNCTRFYECNHGYPFLIQCPPDTAFDSHLDVCAYSPGGKCLPEVPKTRQVRSTPDLPDQRTARLGRYCPRQNHQWTTYLQDISNCSRFYTCSSGVAYLHHCPQGLEFNAYLMVCDYPYSANCRTNVSEFALDHPEALSRATREVPSSTRNNGPSLAKKCPKEDGDWPTFLIDPEDCRRYYECSHGRPLAQECPAGLVFSTTTLTCDRREFVDCNRRSQ